MKSDSILVNVTRTLCNG